MNSKTQIYKFLLFSLTVLGICTFREAQAASLTISPSVGTFTVGSTFDISVFLDTEKANINTIRTHIIFPPEKLQVIPRTAEQSIIGIYTSPPRFDNQAGIIDLQGGIPGGVNVSNGRIIVVTFRVKTAGSAIVKFGSESQALANDGRGTNVLDKTNNGVYNLVLPPPAGPLVTSETHPDQAKWYANHSVILTWSAEEAVQGYSYVLNDLPIDVPDEISEGSRTNLIYKDLNDGQNFFHIKSLRNGIWGGVTHFALNIDASPPADFPIEVVPRARTTRKQPLLQFSTTDNLSGLDHFELKIISLQPENVGKTSQPFFFEVTSPFITQELDLGSYDVIIRAYDKSGNYREKTERLKIVPVFVQYVSGTGLEIRSRLILPWDIFWVIIGTVLVMLVYLGRRLRHWHHEIDSRLRFRELPHRLQEKLGALKKYRARLGKAMVIIFLTFNGIWLSQASAQTAELGPPLITNVSRNITNEEIFYVSGKTDVANSAVFIYLQNLATGETINLNTVSDKLGAWFYRHDKFLQSGSYLLWAQTKAGGQISPPSPQYQLVVKTAAIQFGASRVSLDVLYMIVILVLLPIIIALVVYISVHFYHGRKKHAIFLEELRQTENSIHQEFINLRRGIEAELLIIKKVNLNKARSLEEKQREQQLLEDLSNIENHIGKELWDMEKLEAMR